MEHPASKYHPHHREGSRVFPAEHFCQLRQRRLKCQTSSVSSLVWVTNCWVISDLYSSLRSLKKLCQSLGQSQLGGSGTGSSRFLSGKLLMGSEPWLCPRSLGPQLHLHHTQELCRCFQSRMQWPAQARRVPRDTARCHPHPQFSPPLGKPNTLLLSLPTP